MSPSLQFGIFIVFAPARVRLHSRLLSAHDHRRSPNPLQYDFIPGNTEIGLSTGGRQFPVRTAVTAGSRVTGNMSPAVSGAIGIMIGDS